MPQGQRGITARSDRLHELAVAAQRRRCLEAGADAPTWPRAALRVPAPSRSAARRCARARPCPALPPSRTVRRSAVSRSATDGTDLLAQRRDPAFLLEHGQAAVHRPHHPLRLVDLGRNAHRQHLPCHRCRPATIFDVLPRRRRHQGVKARRRHRTAGAEQHEQSLPQRGRATATWRGFVSSSSCPRLVCPDRRRRACRATAIPDAAAGSRRARAAPARRAASRPVPGSRCAGRRRRPAARCGPASASVPCADVSVFCTSASARWASGRELADRRVGTGQRLLQAVRLRRSRCAACPAGRCRSRRTSPCRAGRRCRPAGAAGRSACRARSGIVGAVSARASSVALGAFGMKSSAT